MRTYIYIHTYLYIYIHVYTHMYIFIYIHQCMGAGARSISGSNPTQP